MSDDVLRGDEEQDVLFDIEPDWKDVWREMPEFAQEDLEPKHSILVHFATKADRARFAKLVDQNLYDSTQSIWYPKAEIGRIADRRWVTAQPVNPHYPIYVISKGRWEKRLTTDALERIGVPYHVVVEPQERDNYAQFVDPSKILVLPFSNLGQGSIPARNWVWDHAVSTGALRHWILDDNMDGFYRLHNNLKVQVETGATFRAAEDFSDRYENVAISGFNYFMFAARKSAGIRPYTLNTRIYSCILIKNDIPYRWRGRYNEDTDLSIRVLKDGWCTVLFNAFLTMKSTTMTMKGGNTDELYVDDGRLKMAESLREQHPDCVVVTEKWGRPQHHVNYSRFADNALILKPGVNITDEINDYGMTLDVRTADEWNALKGKQLRKRVVERPQAPVSVSPSTFSFLQALAAGSSSPASAIEKPSQPEEKPATASPEPESSQLEPESPAAQVKTSLAARGHRLLTRDGRFFVSDAGRLTEEDRAAIKQHREQLIALAEPWNSDTAMAGVSRLAASEPEVHATERVSVSLFDEPRQTQTLAQFLGNEQPRTDPNYTPNEPPSLDGINEVVLNFATSGLNWHTGDRPVGVTVSTLDGQMTRFLPFAFRHGGNLDEATVKRWAERELRGKKITNSKTKFDVHHAREWGIDLEAQGCTFSDIQHTAALLDDHRKRFALDVLAADYFPGETFAQRVDESRHAEHHASEVAEREKVTAQLVGRLRAAMYPELEKQELMDVQRLEDDVIPAVVEMEKNGSPLDLELLEQFHAEANRRYDELLWEVARECGFAFDHTAKGWQLLFERLGLPPTDGNAEAIINLIDHPTVKKAHLAAQYASLNSKTFKAYKEAVGADGILRFEINQLRGDEGGTVSGRFSIGYVQQVPNHDNHAAVFGEDLFPRRLFVPGSGDYFEADAMQIEQRLLVHYMDNAEIIKQYEGDYDRLMRGEDPVSFHKIMWALLKQSKPDMLYSHTKSFDFAKQYGARSIKLAVMMGFITDAEGDEIRQTKRWDDPRLKMIKEIEAAYKKMVPEGDALLDRAAHLAKPKCDEYCKRSDALHRQYPHRGYVKTLVGRRSRFPTNYKTYIGLNRVLQGTGADIMKRKLAELHRERKHTGFVIRLTVHDAVGGDATQPETAARVSEILNQQSYPLKVPILWSAKTGANWAECK